MPNLVKRLAEATAAFEAGELARAEELCRAAVSQQPNDPSALHLLTAVLEAADRYDEALEICRRAESLAPNCPLTQYNLGNVLRAMAQNDEAIAHFQRAVALDPGFTKVRWNLSLACLSAGDFERGWPAYAAREATGQAVFDKYPHPLWAGESLHNKTLLIHAEQGIGDEVLFASCYADIIPRAKQTVLVCDPRLKALFARSFPTARVVGHRRRVDRKPPTLDLECDMQIPAGGLPQYVRPSVESFPQRKRFLLPDPVARREWLRRYEQLGPGPKIGISWEAGGQPSERRRRTARLELWRDLFALPGVHFINLQYGDAADELAAAREQYGATIHDWPHNDKLAADPLVDLDAFAAKVAALDLVISVGNVTVHLAGALGVNTWAILPLVPAWRWMLKGEQSIWYPSVRLFRQTERGEWASVFEQVFAELTRNICGTMKGDRSLRSHAEPASEREHLLSHKVDSTKRLLSPSVRTDAAHFRQWSDLTRVFEQAVAAYRAGDTGRAEQICLEILQHSPRHVEALRLSATIARQAGRLDDAIRLLTRAGSAQDNDPQLQWELGGALQAAGRLDDAANAFERAIALRPDFAKGHNAVGGVHMHEGRHDEAVAAFRRAAELQPDYMAAHNNLGLALGKQGRNAEAIACFHRAAELAPESPLVARNLKNAIATRSVREAAGVRRGNTREATSTSRSRVSGT